ncbi:hypothetical protein CYLTODRAFT_491316 [Cylindrobasidium torrendii FP15055 ss-10]|uniref:Uncharacterized protein n=1 Tax=Cylindrobasidium torrendii FP15055 ss-10 TaxID=1314674 RepID=A0A0D7B8M2_9AGAR|nr:hypothetical protein CYLTODRAFT_491316 [Cylindrobasidium torrendii FP15055 ss-10]
MNPEQEPDLHLYADLCAELIPNFPNVRVHWRSTKGQKPRIDALLPVIRKGGQERMAINDCPGISYRGLEQVCTQLFRQAKGAVDNPITLVVCARSPVTRLSCIGNLPFLVAAASTKNAPVKLICVKAHPWKGMFLSAKRVANQDRCFALTAADYSSSDPLKYCIDHLSPLTITDAPNVGMEGGPSVQKRGREEDTLEQDAKRHKQY